MLHRRLKDRAVLRPRVFELAFKALLEAREETCFLLMHVMFMTFEEVHDHGRNERSGEEVGRQHREDDGFRQRHKEEPCYAGEEKHGNEDDTDAKSRYESRNRDLLRALENRLLEWLVHLEIAVDVFNGDGCVVNKNADGECQSSKGHDVEGLAERAEDDDRGQNRERDRGGDDDRVTPASEEQKDHRGRQTGRGQSFAEDTLNCCSNE